MSRSAKTPEERLTDLRKQFGGVTSKFGVYHTGEIFAEVSFAEEDWRAVEMVVAMLSKIRGSGKTAESALRDLKNKLPEEVERLRRRIDTAKEQLDCVVSRLDDAAGKESAK